MAELLLPSTSSYCTLQGLAALFLEDLVAISIKYCTHLFKLKMAVERHSTRQSWKSSRKMGGVLPLIAYSKYMSNQGQRTPIPLSPLTSNSTRFIMQHGAISILGASSPYPDTVVVKVPPRCEESTKLVLVCDWLSTTSSGRDLLEPAPPFVFDFTFVCLVVLQNCTLPQCLSKVQ